MAPLRRAYPSRPHPGFKLNVPMLLRLNMFHLLQAVSPNSIGLDIGVPARGLDRGGVPGPCILG